MKTRRITRRRRGLAVPEYLAVFGILAAISFVLWSTFGGSVRDDMQTTAGGAGDPSQLVQRFGKTDNDNGRGDSRPGRTPDWEEYGRNQGGGGDSGSPSGGEGGSDDHGRSSGSRSRGNNGVGNGEDGQPPGNPPVNDGAGTGPGNPGNRGGANRDDSDSDDSGSEESDDSDSDDSDSDDSDSDSDDSDGRSRPKGNNGVGNGEDPQPPGNPPINDGPGTGPGNPGNRGGAYRDD